MEDMYTFQEWKIEYWNELYNLFNIVHKKYQGNYDNDWNKFDEFCIFVFKKDHNIE